MKYIETLHEGERLSGIYLCKYRQSAMTKNGKSYENVILQDKTGVIDAKIWDPNSQGIEDFDMLDYIDVVGDVTSFQGALQVSIKRVRKAREGEYIEEDYLPVSERNIDEMYEELLMNEENTIPTKMKGIMISTGKEVGYSEVDRKLTELKDAMEGSDEAALHVLEHVVPTYTITHNS